MGKNPSVLARGKKEVSGLIKIEKQMEAGKYTVLFLDASLPLTNFKKVLIDGKEYTPEIVYDMKDCIGVEAKGDFTGQEIKFI